MQQYNKTMQKKINFDDVTKENVKENNLDWPQIPDHPDIAKIYLYARDPHRANRQLLIEKKKNKLKTLLMILKLLLNIQIIWMIFIKMLKTTIQIKNVKY